MACGACSQKYRPQRMSVGGPRMRRGIVQNSNPAPKTPDNVPYDHSPISSENNRPPVNPTTGHAESVITTGAQGPVIQPNSTGIDAPDAGASSQVEFLSQPNKVQGEK